MANSTYNGRYFALDTIGVIHPRPLWITKIVLKPNAAGDSVTFKSWNENATVNSSECNHTVTSVATNAITATAHFTAAKCSALDIIKIYYTSTGNNIGTYLIATRDSDDAITAVGATLTDESTDLLYSWKIWTPATEFIIKSQGTTVAPMTWDFHEMGGKRWFPNLAMTAISTSATVDVYLA